MIVFKVITGAAEHFIGRLAEWSHATTLFIWGTALLLGIDNIDNASFAVIRHFADGRHWGAILLAAGAARLVALLLNGTFQWSATLSLCVRSLAAFLSAGVWFAMIVGFAMADPHVPGILTYLVIMVGDMVLAVFTAGKAADQIKAARIGKA